LAQNGSHTSYHTLYIVPTPIGNLEDITLRALRTLREVSLIAAEDTRTTRQLLSHYQISTPLTAYYEHNKLSKQEAIFEALQTGDVALVSDAGTPGISDPGHELIGEAIARGVAVVPLPGPSALISALVGAGLPSDRFLFVGFLPRKAGALKQFCQQLASETSTIIAYESPNRLVESLSCIVETLGEDRPVVVARELSKLYEEFRRGPASAVLAHFTQTPPRGEIVLLIGGASAQTEKWAEAEVKAALAQLMAEGLSRREAAKELAARSGWPARDLYGLGLGR
jgi:16S rRNA (cytidine1402-2'-O)-methyltransferase